jgi:RimJ/RimL family protein N-acetyltransferase
MIDHGHGVQLGPLRSWNLEVYRQWRNDPKIYSWCRQWDQITDTGQKRWFESVDRDPATRMYEIMHNGDTVGVCGLTSIDMICRRAEFSVYIAPEWQGHRFGELALKTLLSHGFKAMGLHCIWGETFDGNHAAKIFERVGFTKEGTRRQFYFKNGKFIDAHLYSILASEWK